MSIASFKEEIIHAWINKIKAHMREKPTAVATFVMGADFDKSELIWIRDTLCPRLIATGELTADVYYIGTGNGCDCNSSNCRHGEGREFVVTLK